MQIGDLVTYKRWDEYLDLSEPEPRPIGVLKSFTWGFMSQRLWLVHWSNPAWNQDSDPWEEDRLEVINESR